MNIHWAPPLKPAVPRVGTVSCGHLPRRLQEGGLLESVVQGFETIESLRQRRLPLETYRVRRTRAFCKEWVLSKYLLTPLVCPGRRGQKTLQKSS